MIEVTRKLRRRSGAAVYDGGRARAIIVELAPPGKLIGFRLAKRRKTYCLPIDWCYREAVRAELARAKSERAKQRKERSRG